MSWSIIEIFYKYGYIIYQGDKSYFQLIKTRKSRVALILKDFDHSNICSDIKTSDFNNCKKICIVLESFMLFKY